MTGKALTIYCDGGSRGNPGYSACSFVVVDGEEIVVTKSFFLGVSTNNQSEYLGVVNALLWTLNNKVSKDVVIVLDSELVVKQLTGEYKIKDEKLQMLHKVCKNLENKLGVKTLYKHVFRDKNFNADKALNELLDLLEQ